MNMTAWLLLWVCLGAEHTYVLNAQQDGETFAKMKGPGILFYQQHEKCKDCCANKWQAKLKLHQEGWPLSIDFIDNNNVLCISCKCRLYRIDLEDNSTKPVNINLGDFRPDHITVIPESGRFLLSDLSRTQLWDITNGDMVNSFPGNFVQLLNDQKEDLQLLVTATSPPFSGPLTHHVFRMDNFKPAMRIYERVTNVQQFFDETRPDSGYAIFLDDATTETMLFNTVTNNPVAVLIPFGTLRQFSISHSFSCDGRYVVAAFGDVIVDRLKGVTVIDDVVHDGPTTTKFSPACPTELCFVKPGARHELWWWHGEGFRRKSRVFVFDNRPRWIAWSQDGKRIGVVTEGGDIYVFEKEPIP